MEKKTLQCGFIVGKSSIWLALSCLLMKAVIHGVSRITYSPSLRLEKIHGSVYVKCPWYRLLSLQRHG